MKIVIATDKFKGSLDAPAVASAMRRGARRAYPAADVVVRRVADGGEGTMEALTTGTGSTFEQRDVTGPLGAKVRASFALKNDNRAILEMAAASGLSLVSSDQRDPLRASSTGTGELIVTASARLTRGGTVLVGVGGSASTDGGTGAAGAAGWRFLDRWGRDLPPGGGSLRALATIARASVSPSRREVEIVGACDVANPLLGPAGAAAVFARQKGASGSDIEMLEEGLAVLAARIDRDIGIGVGDIAYGGAGGGLAAGLVAFFGARLTSGIDLVAYAIGLGDEIDGADVVVTGEGKLDATSLAGKTAVGVARLARSHGVPCVAIAGDVGLTPGQLASVGIARAVSIVAAVGAERALNNTPDAIEEATYAALLESNRWAR